MAGILIVDQIQNSSNTLLINSGALAANTVGTTQLGSITNINSGFGNAMTLQANGTTAITVDTNQRTIVAGATNGGSYDSTSSGIYFQKQTSSAEVNVPFIRSEGDSTTTHLALGPSSTSGQLRFYQNGSQRWYINGSGNLTAYGSGLGITFNNASALTNSILNDYETGTWTPRFDGSGTSGSASYSFQSGFYTKIGNMVYASYDIAASSTLSGATGQLCIRGLPFTVASNTYDPVGGGNVGYFNSFTGVTPYTITHYLDASGNYAYFVYGNGSASTVQYMAVNNVTTNSRVIGVIFYRAAF